MKQFIVITTINSKTDAIFNFEKLIHNWQIILVGDKKSAPIYSNNRITFLSIETQSKLDYKLNIVCPYNHYTRKNIGYLYAIQNGADIIYDTDDDNLPYDDWKIEDFASNNVIDSEEQFINIYKNFSDQHIWPRGFPLDEISKKHDYAVRKSDDTPIGVWQGLADIDPDVDAIFRLVLKKDIIFDKKPPVFLTKGSYCPFNSQNTVWRKELFPLLYLPATTSFRFTDILRGYIAQRLMWEQDLHLGFTKATVYQERNAHDFMKDFADEWQCYLHVKPIVQLLNSINFSSLSLIEALEKAYLCLVKENFVSEDEIPILKSWISDCNRLMN